MANTYFQFKQFTIQQDKCAMKVTTDGCLFGAFISQWPGKGKILDIGTGTGLLALMMARQAESFIDAIEIDKDAFEQAAENIAASPWTDRIKVIHTDAREFIAENKYDTIVSNPPFYEKELKGDDAKRNLAHHNEGLLFPELLEIIKKNLAPDGTFFLLLPFKRNDEIKQLLAANDVVIRKMVFVRQSVNHTYFRIMLAGKFNNAEPTETIIDEMAIKDKDGSYTPAFTFLLKDYYLHL